MQINHITTFQVSWLSNCVEQMLIVIDIAFSITEIEYWAFIDDALPSHGVKPTLKVSQSQVAEVETWRHAPGFQL